MQKLGYGYTFILCFVCYAIRFGLISVAPTPWWIILIDFLTLGPSFALSHTTLVAFANAVSLSATYVSSNYRRNKRVSVNFFILFYIVNQVITKRLSK